MAKRRGRNEGSIWKEGNRWRAAVSLDGKRTTKSFTTKEQSNEWIREMKNQIDKGLTYTATQLTLQQYLTDWLPIHKTGLTPKTGERYEQITRDYILPYLGKYKLKDLRSEHVEKCYQTLLQNHVGSRLIRFAHSILHRCLSDGVKRGIIGFNAAYGARKPKLIQKEMKILDESQVLQFLIAAQGDRYEALYHLAIRTGMRQGEILGLKWSDLDWNRGIIRVNRQAQRVKGRGMVFFPPKTKSGRRSIQLGGQMMQLLREHRSRLQVEKALAGDRWQENDLIFPTMIGTIQSQSEILKRFKRLLQKAGLEKIRFHDLRHTAASLMLNNGVPALVVSKILGHSKPSTTLDIYGHLIPIMQEDAANIMDELVTPIPVKIGDTVQLEPSFEEH
jgi:integrase